MQKAFGITMNPNAFMPLYIEYGKENRLIGQNLKAAIRHYECMLPLG